MSRQAWIATLLIAIAIPLPAWGEEDCVTTDKTIEELPFYHTWNNCSPEPHVFNVKTYTSKSCFLDTTQGYSAADVVYKVKLHEGNQVAFLLTPLAMNDRPKRDFVLTVLDTCGDGKSCVSSSTDFIGTDPEQISAVKYPPGIYYLNVDSAEEDGQCGWYLLSAIGVNPTPKLTLTMTPSLSPAVAGTPLTYNFAVENTGGAATRVVLEHTLPPNIRATSYSPGCEEAAGKIVCKKVDGAEFPWKVSVTLDIPANADSRITSSARVSAAEGVPAESKVTSAVRRVHDLSIQLSASPGTAIAGRDRTYTLIVRNDGPSDATEIQVIDTPDGSEVPVEGSATHFVIPTLKAGSTAPPQYLTVRIKPSAQALSNQATVGTATGSEPGRNKGPNSARLMTLVGRSTDLSIEPIKTTRQEPIAAGAEFNYVIPVRNHGPSDSSGGTVTVELSDALCLVGPNDECQPDMDSITYAVPPIGAGDKKDIVFAVKTSPSLQPTNLSNTAQVASNETDPVKEEKLTFTTEFNVQADLGVVEVEATETESMCEGENVLYTIKFHNDGFSNSSKGTVTSKLDGLSFVASLDDCRTGNDNMTVLCSTGDLPAGAEGEVHFRAVTTRPGTVKNKASAAGEEDPHVDEGMAKETTVTAASDLEMNLSAQYLLKPDELFTYEVTVINHGPSDADNVEVDLALPPNVASAAREGCEACLDGPPCKLSFSKIEADSLRNTRTKTICAHAPSQTGKIDVSASIRPRSCDPHEHEEAGVLITTVAADTDADLSLTLTVDGDRKPVSEGDLLTYNIFVFNHGFATAEDIKVNVDLAPGLTSEENCSPCAVDSLAPNTGLTRKLKVMVGPGAASLIETSASASADPPNDPYTDNNSSTTFTQRTARLVAPFLAVDADTGNPMATFTLNNPSDSKVSLRYDVLMAGDPISRSIDLDPNAMTTVSLRDLPELHGKGPQAAHVRITPTSDDGELSTGDFIQTDSGTDAGERLISTKTGLCRSWSVRFLDGLPEGSSTELLFFVPGHQSGVAATGRVFAESGGLAETITIPSDQEAFRYLVDAPVLVSIGSIELTFNNDLMGSVTAVHSLRNGDKVAVPGFCRDHARAQTLILPFVQTNKAINTYIAVRNETDDNVHLKITYPGGEEASHPIAAHALRIVNLRALRGEVEGALKVEAFKSADEKQPVAALSGDFIRVGPDGLAGSALIDSSTQLCRTWSVRFVQDAPRSETRFLVYRQEKGNLTLTAHKEDGDTLSATPPKTEALSFLVSASELVPSGSGSIEWDFGEDADGGDRKGYVAMLLSGEGGQSVLIPGACLPDEETPEDPPH